MTIASILTMVALAGCETPGIFDPEEEIKRNSITIEENDLAILYVTAGGSSIAPGDIADLDDTLLGTSAPDIDIEVYPQNGALYFDSNKVIYKPRKNYFGEDYFEFSRYDSYDDVITYHQNTITIIDVNTPPEIEGVPFNAVGHGQEYEFVPYATDSDSEVLVFSIVNKPSWADFDSYTGRLWGTPAAEDMGEHPNIQIFVSDGESRVGLDPFTITVKEGYQNQPPVIFGVPSTYIDPGEYYSFAPEAHDAEDDLLTFSIANKPSWASFNPATGALTGTPGDSDLGARPGTVIYVSDGHSITALSEFTIWVGSVEE